MEKTIFYTLAAQYEIFFDQEGKLITYIHENDATFRSEYQSSLFKHFGIETKFFALSDSINRRIETDRNWIDTGDVEEMIKKYIMPSLQKELQKTKSKK